MARKRLFSVLVRTVPRALGVGGLTLLPVSISALTQANALQNAQSVAWVAPLGVTTPVASATVPIPSLSQSPFYPIPQTNNGGITIKDISCPSTSFCMAVGFYSMSRSAGEAEIWNGSTWTSNGVPNTSILMGVSCPSTTWCLAVGANNADNGTMSTWTPSSGWQTSIVGGQEVTTSVSCPAVNDCWAVGRSYPASGTQAYYGSVVAWYGAPSYGNAITNIQQLTAISCPSTSWCIALGNTSYNGAGAYDGAGGNPGATWGAYSIWQGSPGSGGSWSAGQADGGATTWNSVTCSAVDACLSAGDVLSSPNGIPVVGSFNGSWSFPSPSVPSGITTWTGISCPSANDCWLSGFGQPRRGGYYTNAVEIGYPGHWSLAKQWNSNTYLESVGCTPNSYCIGSTGGSNAYDPYMASPNIIELSSGVTLSASASELYSGTTSETSTSIQTPWGSLGAYAHSWSTNTVDTQLYPTNYYAQTHTDIGSWYANSTTITVPPNGTTPGVALPSSAYPIDSSYHQGIWAGAGAGWVTANGTNLWGSQQTNGTVTGVARAANGHGYLALTSSGYVWDWTALNYFGETAGNSALLGGDTTQAIGIALTPDNGGYWELMQDGMVIPFGDAMFYGSPLDESCTQPGAPICQPTQLNSSTDTSVNIFGQWDGAAGLIPTPDGQGYMIASASGGVQPFGDGIWSWDTFQQGINGICPQGSSCPLHTLNRPINNITANPQSYGYYLTAKDGGVFSGGGDVWYGTAYNSNNQLLNRGGDPMYIGMIVGPYNNYEDLVASTGAVVFLGGTNPSNFPTSVNTAGGNVTSITGT